MRYQKGGTKGVFEDLGFRHSSARRDIDMGYEMTESNPLVFSGCCRALNLDTRLGKADKRLWLL